MGFGIVLNVQHSETYQTNFADHLGLLIERQDDLLAQLTQIANEGFSKAKEECEKNLFLWNTNLPRSPFSSLLLLRLLLLFFCRSLTLFISRQMPGET